MQRRNLPMKVLLLAVLAVAGCMSAQQIRDNNIAHNIQIFNSFSAAVQEKVRLGQIDLGFTRDMVSLAWGAPDRELVRRTEQGEKIVWTYTRSRFYPRRELMEIPVHYIDGKGKERSEYHSVWVNSGTEEEYAVAQVEFSDGLVSAIEQIKR